MSSLYSETFPVYRTNITTTALIDVISCITIHGNRATETYYEEDFILNYSIIMQGISLLSNATSSSVFVTRPKVIDSMKDCSMGL